MRSRLRGFDRNRRFFLPVRLIRAHIILDVKCPASGEAERNHWSNLLRLRPEKDEVKFVIAEMSDWEFAKSIIAEYDLLNGQGKFLYLRFLGCRKHPN